MEHSMNRIELRGRVGQDPRIVEVGGNSVANFTLATNEVIKDRNGNVREVTTWHNIVAWAGKGMPYFEEIRKGTCLYVLGKIRNQKYTNQEGVERSYTEVLASRMVLDPPKDRD